MKRTSTTALNAVTLAFAIELEKENIKVNATSPGFTDTALNNFQGTVSVEVGSREPVRVALEQMQAIQDENVRISCAFRSAFN